MAWVKPLYGRGRVDAAGATLLIELDVEDVEDVVAWFGAIEKVSNWRSAHAYPLHALAMTLRSRAKKVDAEVLIAQRIKRLPSIINKLKREPHMKLSQVQDLGGCRAVLRDIAAVEQLADVYRADHGRARPDRSLFHATKDYISNPRATGYRGIHFIYKYNSASAELAVFNGLRIEIQLRTKLQHAWATAVETVDTITGQALKSNLGDSQWKRFFALASSAFAIREERPIVPGTPSDFAELHRELLWAGLKLDVGQVLTGWGSALRHALRAKAEDPKARMFLLVLDYQKKIIGVTGFSKDELPLAQEQYQLAEARGDQAQAVLVAVDSLAALKKAYPNYYLDTRMFIAELVKIVAPSPRRSVTKDGRVVTSISALFGRAF